MAIAATSPATSSSGFTAWSLEPDAGAAAAAAAVDEVAVVGVDACVGVGVDPEECAVVAGAAVVPAGVTGAATTADEAACGAAAACVVTGVASTVKVARMSGWIEQT